MDPSVTVSTVIWVWASAQKSNLLNGVNQEEVPGESRLCLHALFSYFSQIIPSCLGLKAECWAA